MNADVVILGCIELPIMFLSAQHLPARVNLTAVLAKKCVAIALQKQAREPG
ncbi:hypothetical protein SAMN04487996_1434 [Dyadobacter soli]|uniref:Aspartate racemase n=1 Tax=Dyadobacter soli TaxID=659014 RepID=A0A1G8D5H0_9BACT|nr:hypothetical protein SAMN04487996_1434 [Dyadobacter soli]